MDTPLISVIIPVYKVEKYINRCIESILCQSYSNLEIILVDDGSPDKCGDICDEFATHDSRITVHHKKNGGLSDARNYGVERSNGKYITFVDSDDYIAPNYIEYLYMLINKYNADISVCCRVETGCDSVEYPVNELLPDEQLLTGYEACESLFGELYLTLVTAWGKLYDSKIIKKYTFPVGKIHEDEATTCKYYYESKQVVIGNKCLYSYFINDNSITRFKRDNLNLDAIWAFKHRAEFFESNNEKKLGQLAWSMLFEYYANDSENHNGRCDRFIKDLEKSVDLSGKLRFKVKLYNTTPIAFKIYKWFRKIYNGVKKVFKHSKRG